MKCFLTRCCTWFDNPPNMFDYSKEPVNDYFLDDMKCFYSSLECVERNLDPLTIKLVVISQAGNIGAGLTLASSPMKKMKFLMLVDLFIRTILKIM